MPMRPTSVRLSAAGFSPWIPINRMSNSFGIGFGCTIESGATLTYSVQHTFDDLYAEYTDFTVARVTTTATVTQANHGLKAGDWVYIKNAGAPFDGFFEVVSITDVNNFTYTVENSGPLTASLLASLQKARVFDHTDIDDETGNTDGNYQFPPRAIRIRVSAWTDGFVDLTVIAAGK